MKNAVLEKFVTIIMVTMSIKVLIFVSLCTCLNFINGEKIFMTDEEFVNENEELSKNNNNIVFYPTIPNI